MISYELSPSSELMHQSAVYLMSGLVKAASAPSDLPSTTERDRDDGRAISVITSAGAVDRELAMI